MFARMLNTEHTQKLKACQSTFHSNPNQNSFSRSILFHEGTLFVRYQLPHRIYYSVYCCFSLMKRNPAPLYSHHPPLRKCVFFLRSNKWIRLTKALCRHHPSSSSSSWTLLPHFYEHSCLTKALPSSPRRRTSKVHLDALWASPLVPTRTTTVLWHFCFRTYLP